MMKNIPIVNKEILQCLDEFLWFYDNIELVKRNCRLNGRGLDRKWFVGEEYRDEIVRMAERHDGYPETTRGYNLKADRLELLSDNNNEEVAELISRYNNMNSNLCAVLGARNNALTMFYPEDGFISWHNNANASAYNLIFSWSETGEGCFKYIDGDTGEEIVMQDKKGWQCKAGYFGAYGEPWNNLVYHAAETDCWRLTVSFIFDRSDISMGIQDEVIEEIMSDF